MDTNQWPQGIGLVKPSEGSKTALLERKPRPHKEQALNCPRCNSTNTKFCYYNNYSLSQPRYFCKTCRRYWTEGGTLRNVPVGGGSRKNKRSTSSSSSSSSPAASLKKLSDLTTPSFSQSSSQNPKIHEGQDLNLAYPPTATGTGDYSTSSTISGLHFPFSDSKSLDPRPNANSSNLPALELLKAGISSGGSLSSLMSMPLSDSNSIFYSSVLPLHELKPKFNFSLAGLENGYGSVQEPVQDTGARLFLPYEELKPLSTATDQYEQNKGQGESTGYWNGMFGGGSW